MKTKFLFPHRLKRIGWIVSVPSSIIGFLIIFYDFNFKFLDSTKLLNSSLSNFTDEIFGVLFIIGAIFVAFSEEKQEDEFIAKTRVESLVWATYINYFILILCFLFVYGDAFLKVMMINMFTILVFFIARFNYVLYRTNKYLSHEK